MEAGSASSQTPPAPKKRRSGNTSVEQQELYIKVLEGDSIFRTGIMNPKVEIDYNTKKWEELTSMLNSVVSGAVLTSAMWKKRFNDWKNFIRHKARTITENKKKTGGGPELNYALTNIEERALNVFGKIVVAGSSRVTVMGGLQQNDSPFNS